MVMLHFLVLQRLGSGTVATNILHTELWDRHEGSRNLVLEREYLRWNPGKFVGRGIVFPIPP